MHSKQVQCLSGGAGRVIVVGTEIVGNGMFSQPCLQLLQSQSAIFLPPFFSKDHKSCIIMITIKFLPATKNWHLAYITTICYHYGCVPSKNMSSNKVKMINLENWNIKHIIDKEINKTAITLMSCKLTTLSFCTIQTKKHHSL